MYQFWVIAGPNGAGKSTLTRRHLAGRLPIINPDDIAQRLNPANPDAPDVAMRAGREALQLQRQHIAGHRTFAVETTLSGNRELNLMKEAKAAGYKVNLVFICTETPMISIGRITVRVAEGGHHVPSADVVRRYGRSLQNLAAGMALADRVWLLDNTRARMRLVASLERGQVKSIANSLPKWVKTAKLPALEHGAGLSL